MRADYEGMERCPRDVDYRSVYGAVERLAAAVQKVECYSDRQATEIAEVISIIAPLRPLQGDPYPSGSCSTCPGAVYLTIAEEPDILAELLIHECGHNKLFLLQTEDRLLDPNIPGQGWEDMRYYSPWRDAPRSLQGILHAFFVFTEVACFWRWQLENALEITSCRVAERRLKTLCEQLKLADEVLSNCASFTCVGEEVFRDVQSRLGSLSEAAEMIDGERTEVMHVLYASERYRGLSVNEAVRRHHADHAPK